MPSRRVVYPEIQKYFDQAVIDAFSDVPVPELSELEDATLSELCNLELRQALLMDIRVGPSFFYSGFSVELRRYVLPFCFITKDYNFDWYGEELSPSFFKDGFVEYLTDDQKNLLCIYLILSLSSTTDCALKCLRFVFGEDYMSEIYGPDFLVSYLTDLNNQYVTSWEHESD